MSAIRRLRRPSPLGLFGGLVLLFLYAPLLLVVLNAFNADRSSLRWGGFTLEWVKDAVHDDRVIRDLGNSTAIAIAVGLISVVLAAGLSLWWRRAGRRAQQTSELVSYARIVMPEIVLAMALLTLFAQLDLPLGAGAIIAGQVVFTAAVATQLIRARMVMIGRTYEDAAADLGARPLRVLRRVTLPLLAPALGAAAVVCFTFSFDDVVTPAFLGGSSTETLPVLIFGLTHRGTTAEVYAIAMIALTITVVLFILAGVIGGRRGIRAIAGDRDVNEEDAG
jgi:ABC-type spermidine/putrescine transport system permease subunit II